MGSGGADPLTFSVANTGGTAGTNKTITAITRANQGVVTAVAHGFSTGNRIAFSNVVGMTPVSYTHLTLPTILLV